MHFEELIQFLEVAGGMKFSEEEQITCLKTNCAVEVCCVKREHPSTVKDLFFELMGELPEIPHKLSIIGVIHSDRLSDFDGYLPTIDVENLTICECLHLIHHILSHKNIDQIKEYIDDFTILFDRLIEICPVDRSYYYRSLYHDIFGSDKELALQDLDKSFELNPLSTDSLRCKAIFLQKHGDIEGLIEHTQQTIRLHQKHVLPLTFDKFMETHVLELLRELLDREEYEDSNLALELFHEYLKYGDHEEQYFQTPEEYEAASQLRKNHLDRHGKSEVKKWDEYHTYTVEDWVRIATHSTNNLSANLHLGLHFLSTGEMNKAVQFTKEAERIFDDGGSFDPHVQYQIMSILGSCHMKNEEYPESLKYLTNAIDMLEQDLDLANGIGEVQRVSYLKTTLKLRSHTYEGLGMMELKEMDLKKAEEL